MTKKEGIRQLWLRDPKFNRGQASRDLNCNRRQVNKYIKEFENEYGVKGGLSDGGYKTNTTNNILTEAELESDLENININSTMSESSGSISAKGSCKEEEFSQEKIIELTIQKSGIDTNLWEIKSAKVGFHHVSMKPKIKIGNDKDGKPIFEDKVVRVTNWNCSIQLKPMRTPFIRDAIRNLVDQIKPIEPLQLTYAHMTKSSDKYAGELIPVDIHFGKLAWGLETLAGNMDLKVAKKVFIEACMENLSEMSLYPISKIFIIVGNDLLHFENYMATTAKGGHSLDVDGRLPKAIQVTKESLLYVIDQAIQIAPVQIMRIPGNHDMHASYWMCEILKERYRNNKHVVVDNGPSPRKVITWGKTLIGLTHDASAGLQTPTVNMLPQFWPTEWGKSRWREWHTGHKHKKETTKYKPIMTLGGVIIRQIAGLTDIDAWHVENCFTDAVPACESFVFHKDSGMRTNINHNIDYKKY